jgi:hypothetical protein
MPNPWVWHITRRDIGHIFMTETALGRTTVFCAENCSFAVDFFGRELGDAERHLSQRPGRRCRFAKRADMATTTPTLCAHCGRPLPRQRATGTEPAEGTVLVAGQCPCPNYRGEHERFVATMASQLTWLTDSDLRARLLLVIDHIAGAKYAAHVDAWTLRSAHQTTT